MRSKRLSKYGAIALSVLMALLLWFYIVNQDASGTPRNTLEVDLSYVNAGADYTISGPQAVSVSLWGSAPEPSDIQAYVDLAGLDEGEHRLNVHVTPVPGALFVSVQPNEVTVELIGVQEKQLRISKELIGSPAAGTILSDVALSSDHCILRGDSETLAKVAVVAAPIIIEGVSGVLDQEVVLQPRDAEGNILAGLTLLPEQVRAMAVAERQLSSRTLAVQVLTMGEPAEGYELEFIRPSQQEVTVLGYESLLRDLESVPTIALDLSGRESDFSAVLELDLPAGVSASPSQIRVEVGLVELAGQAVTAEPGGDSSPSEDNTPGADSVTDESEKEDADDEADRS